MAKFGAKKGCSLHKPFSQPPFPLAEYSVTAIASGQSDKKDTPSNNSNLGALVLTEDGTWTVQDKLTGECYHSRMGARREAEELYIKLSGFSDSLRIQPPQDIRVLDVGLGLGYNASATIAAWLESPNPPSVLMVSLEKSRKVIEELLSPDAPWTQNWEPNIREALAKVAPVAPFHWQGVISHGSSCRGSSGKMTNFVWKIFELDAANSPLPFDLPDLHQQLTWDFIWQDPFSPQMNPDMWSSSWFTKLLSHSHPHTKLLTYSVARCVRDALDAAGFSWQKLKTPFPMKKHWLMATPKAEKAMSF